MISCGPFVARHTIRRRKVKLHSPGRAAGLLALDRCSGSDLQDRPLKAAKCPVRTCIALRHGSLATLQTLALLPECCWQQKRLLLQLPTVADKPHLLGTPR